MFCSNFLIRNIFFEASSKILEIGAIYKEAILVILQMFVNERDLNVKNIEYVELIWR